MICFRYYNQLQGFCVPAEELESNESQGTDFVDIEAGGFDQGQGDKNVSNKAEPDNIVSSEQGHTSIP